MWILLSVLIARTASALAIKCYCEGHCPNDRDNGTCEEAPSGYCFSAIEEIWDPDARDYIHELSYGCLPPIEQGLMQCKGGLSPLLDRKNIACCNHGDLCNRDLVPKFNLRKPKAVGLDSIAVFPGIIVSLSLSIAFVIIGGIILCQNRKRKRGSSSESFQSNLTDLNDDNSGSGSGFPFLVRRTIARQLSLSHCIGRGRYGEVWLATWHGEKVAVKVFFTLEEASWFRETEIYQTVLMRHENILGFVAADIKGTGTWTQMLLITDYHEQGSLYDYLQTNTLDLLALLNICYSIASGIAHLHVEILGTRGKPAIAHRDIKSRNILVKRNGECVIADFGLAVRFSSDNGLIDVATNTRVGTRRYMAPEILEERINKTSFDAYKMSDMYSMGLVLWETCRRFAIVGDASTADIYALPYEDVVSSDPSFDDMRMAVCVKKLRPEIPSRWERDAVLFTLSKSMAECWHGNPAVRLTSLRLKKTIAGLRDGILDIEGFA